MTSSMKAVAVVDGTKAQVINMARPQPKPNELQIRIHACALCTWEQRVFIGEKKMPFPFVGGHEIAGEISGLGEAVDPEKYAVGTKVAARVIKACGSCYYCRRGNPTQCTELNTLLLNGPEVYGMGGLAEYICLDKSAVWSYPGDISYEILSLTEPVACVLNSLEHAFPRMGDDAVVIGGGVMGMLHVLCLKLMGVRVILSEPDSDRRAFALSHGCDIVIDPSKEDPVARVLELTSGRGAETVFNTTPIPLVVEQAVRMTGNLGTCVTYSSQHPDSPVAVSPNWLHSSEVSLTGAVNPSIRSFDQAVNLLSKRLLTVDDLISGVFPMEDAQQAFLEAVKPSTYRVVITF